MRSNQGGLPPKTGLREFSTVDIRVFNIPEGGFQHQGSSFQHPPRGRPGVEVQPDIDRHPRKQNIPDIIFDPQEVKKCPEEANP